MHRLRPIGRRNHFSASVFWGRFTWVGSPLDTWCNSTGTRTSSVQLLFCTNRHLISIPSCLHCHPVVERPRAVVVVGGDPADAAPAALGGDPGEARQQFFPERRAAPSWPDSVPVGETIPAPLLSPRTCSGVQACPGHRRVPACPGPRSGDLVPGSGESRARAVPDKLDPGTSPGMTTGGGRCVDRGGRWERGTSAPGGDAFRLPVRASPPPVKLSK